MDLARFRRGVEVLLRLIDEAQIPTLFQNVATQLSNAAGNPTTPKYVEAFRSELSGLRAALDLKDDAWTEGEAGEVVAKLRIGRLVGPPLGQEIVRVVTEHQLSLPLVSQNLQLLHQEFGKVYAQLVALNNAFREFGVEGAGGEPGSSEVVIEAPTSEYANRLEDLSKFAKDWNQDLKTFSEVFDPDRRDVTINGLATGSWLIYLSSAPVVIWGIAKCLKGVNQILREVIETKELLKKLSSKGPPAAIKAMEEHTDAKVATDLAALATQLVDEYYKKDDEGRKAELKVALNQSLRRLAKRLAEGEKVSLRLQPPKRPLIEDGREPTEEEKSQIVEADKLARLRQDVDADTRVIGALTSSAEVTQSLPAPDVADS